MGGAWGIGEVRTRCWWRSLSETPLEDQGVDGRIILKWIFKKLIRDPGLDWPGSEYGQVAGCC